MVIHQSPNTWVGCECFSQLCSEIRYDPRSYWSRNPSRSHYLTRTPYPKSRRGIVRRGGLLLVAAIADSLISSCKYGRRSVLDEIYTISESEYCLTGKANVVKECRDSKLIVDNGVISGPLLSAYLVMSNCKLSPSGEGTTVSIANAKLIRQDIS